MNNITTKLYKSYWLDRANEIESERTMKLTKSQLKNLETLMNDKKLKGNQLLQRYIWLNTVKPVYNIGDKIIFSSNTYHFGNKVDNFIGEIIDIRFMSLEQKIIYTISYKFEYKNKTYERKEYETSINIWRKTKGQKTINKLKETTDNSSDSIPLYI